MMTERNKMLVESYGPRFVRRSMRISDNFLHLAADACSVLTDEEWKSCGHAMVKFNDELRKVRNVVYERLKEVCEGDEDKLEKLLDKADEELKKYGF